MTTGPRSGFSSVACETPDGVSTSIAFGIVAGSAEQIAAVPPGAQTPRLNGCGVGMKVRAWSDENPSWLVSTTVNPQPDPGCPSDAAGTLKLMNREMAFALIVTWPRVAPP